MAANILVVDDQDGLRQSLRRAISRRGYRVMLAHDRISAAYAARRQPIDFAIVDQNLTGALGDRSGLELAADLQFARPKIRIVIITGYPSSNVAFHAGRQAGIVGYLQKPAPIDEMLDIVEGRALGSGCSRPTLHEIQREYALRVLDECGGNATSAAESLGVTRATLRRLLRG